MFSFPNANGSARLFDFSFLFLVNYLSLLLSKAPFISEQFIYFMASTFKPNGSLSSTDDNHEKRNYKDLKVKVI